MIDDVMSFSSPTMCLLKKMSVEDEDDDEVGEMVKEVQDQEAPKVLYPLLYGCWITVML